MKISRKVNLIFGLIVLIAVITVVVFVFIDRARDPYDYSYLMDTRYFEEGSSFTPLQGQGPGVEGKVLAGESENLQLYINIETAQIAVYDKRNDMIWYSNPEDLANDAMANNYEKNRMSSQLVIRYFTHLRQRGIFYSHDKSVLEGNFEILSLSDGGLRVVYTIGDLSRGIESIPHLITPERLEEKILSRIDPGDVRSVTRRYNESVDHPGFLELAGAVGNSVLITNQLLDLFDEAGYTDEDLAFDNEAAGIEVEIDRTHFIIPLEYRLSDDALEVSINLEQIHESGAQLFEMELMPFFGAGSTEDEGYIFVPSGSGAIMYFNNGKSTEVTYRQEMYGGDPIFWERIQTQREQPVRLPVYGIKRQEGAMIAAVTSGSSMTTLRAQVSGIVNSYNNVYTNITLRNSEVLPLSIGMHTAVEQRTLVEQDMYTGTYAVKYMFLPNPDDGYAQMAVRYRQELDLTPINPDTPPPMFLSVIGAVNSTGYFIGIPYKTYTVMTSYDEAAHIAKELNNKGVSGIQMRYLGWFNEGIRNNNPVRIRPIRALGTTKDLHALNDMLSDTGGFVYPDVVTQLLIWNSRNFNELRDSARCICGYSAAVGEYNRAILRQWSSYISHWSHVVSPSTSPGQIDSFLKRYERLGFNGVSLADMGDILASDQSVTRLVPREASLLITEEQLRKINETAPDIMVSGGNMYSLPYTQRLVDIPVSADMFYMLDEQVPFLQIVLHGFIDYAGVAINAADFYDANLTRLRMLEYGIVPHYAMTYAETSELRFTGSEVFYSTHYKDWYEEAVANYKLFAEIFTPLRGVNMIDHINHNDGVFETVFANGTSIFVNYSDNDTAVEGITVAAKGFAVVEGGLNG